jgi:biotin carboxylase
MKKSIMLLGGSKFQSSAVEIARQLGLKTIVVDKNPECFLSKYADEFFPIDLIDINSLVALAVEKKVIGALTLQSDVGIRAIGAINETLNLKGINRETSINCTDKISMRKCLSNREVNQPVFKIVENLPMALSAAQEIGYPIMVKSPNNSGSRGVFRINNNLEMNNFIENTQAELNSGEIIIEKCIVGIEFGAQGFFESGILKFLAIHNDTMGGENNIVPIGHSFPFLSRVNEVSVHSFAQEIGAALGIQDGPANFDFITSEGQLFVIEVGARVGATGLPELVETFFGVDLIGLNVQMFMSDVQDIILKQRSDSVACRIIEAQAEGVIRKIDYSGLKKPTSDLLHWSIEKKSGDLVRKLQNGTDRIGIVMSRGKDVFQAELSAFEACLNISNSIEIEVTK